MPSYQFEGIILKTQDYSETDKFLTIFTKNYGKKRALAKGARKITSRKGAPTDLFVHGIFMAVKGRDIDIVTEVDPINYFTQLKEDLKKAAAAFYLSEILDAFVGEDQESYNMYRLFLETLSLVSRAKKKHDLWVRAFEMKALRELGFGPELYQCSRCSSPIFAEKYFEAACGGLVCRYCLDEGLLVEEEVLLLIRSLQKDNWNELSRLRYEEKHLDDVEGVTNYYITHVLERKLKSAEFMKQAKKLLALSA